MYFFVQPLAIYFFVDLKKTISNLISINFSQFYWSHVLDITKFLKSNQFSFSHKTDYLSKLTFVQLSLIPMNFLLYLYCI